MLRSIRIGALFGIDILIHPGWFVLVGLTTWLLATDIYPDALKDRSQGTHVAMAAVSVVAFFASIVLHEMGHGLVAKAYRIPVRSITLFIFGGVAQITREAQRPVAELLMAAAGPLTSLALAFAFFGAWAAVGAHDNRPADVVLIWLAYMNAVLAVFNLLPAFPMDGGRIFRALLWLIGRSYSVATMIAAWSSRAIAWVMIGAGAMSAAGMDVPLIAKGPGSLWLMLIGFFLENAARQSLHQDRLLRELRKHSAGTLMAPDPPVVDGSVTVGSLARGVLELNPRVVYFVEEEGRLAGIVSADQIRAVPPADWDRVTAAEVMVPSGRMHASPPERPASDVLLEMETEGLNHLPVVAEGRVLGVIARDRILGVLSQAGLLPVRARL